MYSSCVKSRSVSTSVVESTEKYVRSIWVRNEPGAKGFTVGAVVPLTVVGALVMIGLLGALVMARSVGALVIDVVVGAIVVADVVGALVID